MGTQKLLYIRVRFSDDAVDPNTMIEAEADLTESRTIFEAISYHQFSINWTITRVLLLSKTSEEYSSLGFYGLLSDARSAAESAGYNYLDFDLEVVRHNPVSGFRSGYGNIGNRGATVQAGGSSIFVHEIGHNLGLHHANFWDTASPDLSPKISPPFPSNVDEGKEGHPFDPDSVAGHHSVNGQGKSIEYGDPFNIMGGGNPNDGAQYNAPHKSALGWLDETNVKQVEQSGVYRIFNLAGNTPSPGRFLQIQGTSINNLVQLLPDGTIDPDFKTGAGPNNEVRAVAEDLPPISHAFSRPVPDWPPTWTGTGKLISGSYSSARTPSTLRLFLKRRYPPSRPTK